MNNLGTFGPAPILEKQFVPAHCIDMELEFLTSGEKCLKIALYIVRIHFPTEIDKFTFKITNKLFFPKSRLLRLPKYLNVYLLLV